MLTVSSNHIVLGGGSGGGGGSGDVVGAVSSTDNAIARFDGATGKIVQNSSLTIDDDGSLNLASGALTFNYPARAFSIKGNNIEGGRTLIQLLAGNGAQSIFYVDQVGYTNNFVIRNFGTNGTNSGSILLVTNGNMIKMSPEGDLGIGLSTMTAKLDVNGTTRLRGNTTFNAQIVDNTGSSGIDGQVLKKVGGQVIWSNP